MGAFRVSWLTPNAPGGLGTRAMMAVSMPIRGCSPRSALHLLAAVAFYAESVGCTDALKANDHGTGGAVRAAGAMATGGRTGSAGASAGALGMGGAKPTGGVQGAGGASVTGDSLGAVGGAAGADAAGAGGASGGSSGTDLCTSLAYDYCVEHCLTNEALRDNASCTNGSWTCRRGYVLASSCPSRACGVTPDGCCDLTTGVVSENPCAADGYRASCGDGSAVTYRWPEAFCVPKSLAGRDCYTLDRAPCSEPAVACSDMSMGSVDCYCSVTAGSDASTGIWHCSAYIGP
jgi:hypothetical protein